MSETIKQLDWHNCYDDSWDGFIVPEAFAHPAKFARGLITKIYVHMLAERMLVAGDTVVDPFGGIASGGMVAAGWGLRWFGCELESKFVDLGQKNIAMHRALWESFKDPVPVLVQGDSRKLRENLAGVLAEGVVCSPPFESAMATHGGQQRGGGKRLAENGDSFADSGSPGQLGAMPPGSVDSVVSSPPYAECLTGDNTARETAEESRAKRRTEGGSLGQSCRHQGYGGPGNLGNLPSGTVDSVVSSPPFLGARSGTTASAETSGGGPCAERIHTIADGDRLGDTPGQLSALPVGQVDAIATSPPYEGIRQDGGRIAQEGVGGFGAYTDEPADYWHTQRDQNNLGNLKTGDTFWTAARDVVRESFLIIKPGGWSAWVCKDFVRNKARVPFCDDWCRLLESQGFVVTTRVHAMLVKETSHPDLFGGADHVERTERKSFFRRLAEKKGSPRIDWEEVLFARKPA